MAEPGDDIAQVFRPRSNSLMRSSIVVGCLVIAACCGIAWGVWRSPYMTRRDNPIIQPVPFSHEHHAGELGIDCRYCHVSVETEAFAGMPPTETCMTCHSQIWTKAPLLAPVRESWALQQPLHWNRVDNMPAFVFFNHGIHIHKGVGCSTCHGAVEKMPMTWEAHNMWMRWCTTCHNDPKPFLRPQSEIFNMDWRPTPQQQEDGSMLLRQYKIDPKTAVECDRCHR